MNCYKNVSCKLEFIDRDDNTLQRLQKLAEEWGLYQKNVDSENPLPGYTLCNFYWSGYSLTWSNEDLQDWIGEFSKKARKLIGHQEVFIDIHC